MFFLLTKNMSIIINSSPYKNYINFISVPFDFLNKYNIFNYKNVLEKNEKLEKQMIVIESEKIQLQNQEEELANLKSLLKLEDLYTDYQKVYVKTISRNKMYWFDTIIIDKGKEDGINKGDAVISKDGLVGQIQSITKDYSTVKLITKSDKENKISVGVKTAKTFKYGTIIGYDYPYIKVELTTNKEGIKINDKLVTSGLGNFPKNITIGTVEKIEKDSYDIADILYIKPSADLDNLNYLAVLTK